MAWPASTTRPRHDSPTNPTIATKIKVRMVFFLDLARSQLVIFFWNLAHVSRKPMVLLNTGAPSLESASTQ